MSEKFPEKFREITIKEGNIKRIAHIKIDKLVIQFQSKSMTSLEFQEKVDFFSKNNFLVWVVDLRDKEIYGYSNKSITEKYKWNWAWKFNKIDKYNNKEFDLFFQLEDNKFLKVIWNKVGFKYFGGYSYNQDNFIKYLKKKYKGIKYKYKLNI